MAHRFTAEQVLNAIKH